MQPIVSHEFLVYEGPERIANRLEPQNLANLSNVLAGRMKPPVDTFTIITWRIDRIRTEDLRNPSVASTLPHLELPMPAQHSEVASPLTTLTPSDVTPPASPKSSPGRSSGHSNMERRKTHVATQKSLSSHARRAKTSPVKNNLQATLITPPRSRGRLHKLPPPPFIPEQEAVSTTLNVVHNAPHKVDNIVSRAVSEVLECVVKTEETEEIEINDSKATNIMANIRQQEPSEAPVCETMDFDSRSHISQSPEVPSKLDGRRSLIFSPSPRPVPVPDTPETSKTSMTAKSSDGIDPLFAAEDSQVRLWLHENYEWCENGLLPQAAVWEAYLESQDFAADFTAKRFFDIAQQLFDATLDVIKRSNASPKYVIKGIRKRAAQS